MRTTPTNPFAAVRVPGTPSPTPTGTSAERITQLRRTSLSMGEPMNFDFDLS